jgi:hypothetical protein
MHHLFQNTDKAVDSARVAKRQMDVDELVGERKFEFRFEDSSNVIGNVEEEEQTDIDFFSFGMVWRED